MIVSPSKVPYQHYKQRDEKSRHAYLAKVLDIWGLEFFKITSQDLKSAKFQDVAFLSERNREFNEKPFWGGASRDLFTLSGTSEAENTSSFLAKASDI